MGASRRRWRASSATESDHIPSTIEEAQSSLVEEA